MERAFLRHVVECYIHREGPVAAKVEGAHGGDPQAVIETTTKLLRQRSYGRCLVLMDTDRPWPSPLPARICTVPVTFVKAEPVIEGLLLQILGHAGITTRTSVEECKRILYCEYVNSKKRTEPMEYRRRFPRDVLENSRHSCSVLDTILRALK